LTPKTWFVEIVSTIIIGLALLDETLMSEALTDELTRMSKRGTSLRNNKTARCRLAGGGLLATTDPPMAFDPLACVGSNLGFGGTAIAIVIPAADIVDIDVGEKSRH
jgi:hypothetical protein